MPSPFSFDVKLQKACGIDLHKDSIKCCLMDADTGFSIKDYGTSSSQLRLLTKELQSHGIKDVIIESTGIYWMPLHKLLSSEGIRVLIANPLRVKQIPGKKTDTTDAEWLCKLLINGLVSASFIPAEPVRQLRQLSRQRHLYVQQLTQVKNRILKVLEAGNFKLRSVLSNINTKSARKIAEALADNQTDMKYLQSLCLGQAAKKAVLLPEALDGILTDKDRQLLKLHLDDWNYLENKTTFLAGQMQEMIADNYSIIMELLQQVPGIGKQSSCTLIAELGNNLESFPSADHFTSWVGLAPGNRQSANKWFAQHTTKGNKYLRAVLIQIAWAAARTKNGYWQAQFQYMRKRLAAKKAIVAIARKIAKLIYRVITQQYKYEEKGGEYFINQRGKYHSVS
jgi:transposase